ncbi:MAG: beta-lactamase family protein [Candidatus Aminicenantes bacterium]|nr:MAG: beta-lactamase family protein [Candidatus Aminicenantes bacterium]
MPCKFVSRTAHVVLILVLVLGWASAVQGEIHKTDRVDQLFRQWDKRYSPGCAVAVIKKGKIIYKKAYGMADLERSVPLTPESVFDIASNTKQFTAFSVALLAEEGKISLDDNIRQYFPEFPDYGHPITIRHLLYHTSGIREYAMLLLLGGRRWINHYPVEDIMDLIIRQEKLNNTPGDEHIYSNSGYFLLGLLVQRVSGKSLGDFFRQNIFQPLGMKHTYFYDDISQIIKNRAIGYSPRGASGYALEVSLLAGDGSGGILSNLDDLFRWDQNFYHNKLGKGSQDIIKTMLTPGVLNNGKKINYALGLLVGKYKGLTIVTHGGGWNGYRSEIMRFPDQDFSVICLANLGTIDTYHLAARIADIYLADQLKEKPKSRQELTAVSLPLSSLEDKVGSYQNPVSYNVWTLSVSPQGDKLDVKSSSGAVFHLVPTSKTEFKTVGAGFDFLVSFIKPDPFGPLKMKVTLGNYEPVICEPVPVLTLTLRQLKEYVGNYYSEELGAVYKLFLKDKKLMFKVRGLHFDVVMDPTVKDEFITIGPYIKFVRNKAGKIEGFNIRTDGIKNLFLSRGAPLAKRN